ncbi:hypothetical protein [Caballeronia glebae]|uniref:hypothetical protein n=1 Tax=Caballeronia glebae TaxID=1777143 RepID=UPI0038B7342A
MTFELGYVTARARRTLFDLMLLLLATAFERILHTAASHPSLFSRHLQKVKPASR